ncbi:hypothetical protein QJ054_33565 [Streptomyces sp. AN-3]|uniref:hypothetical protein n=1 Tax=Streptomyces sp. AN-3 TaxID=3044177 RepID=UPI00249C6AF7|nr:hypothetical protein [Streptomyces sp. AN-3]MDI3101965.1 hypothetical protein [Streptomyces sp. AN-3]MDV6291359.1 hypothetical protein [Streptomyces sp. UP1A-1]
MPAANLTPVSVLDDALAQARAAARAVLSLVAETLHHQFPTGAYLVLIRPSSDDREDAVTLDSVRDAHGQVLQEIDLYGMDPGRFPSVPKDIAALWGSTDPQDPGAVLDLIQRIDGVSPYEFLDFLPSELRTAEEIRAENDGGRTPLGLPLRSADCPQHGALCEPDDHIEPPTGV